MKTRILSSILFVLFACTVNAQHESGNQVPQTLFSGGTRVTGWFIDVSNSFTNINGRQGYMPGFTGGVIVDRNFRVGLAAKSLSWYESFLRFDNLFEEQAYLNGGYAGLFLEAAPYAGKLIHFSFPFIIGGGGAVYSSKSQLMEIDENEWEWDCYWNELSSSPFFVVEPGVNLELNVTGFMRLYSGYSYRWVKGLNLQHTSQNALNNSNFIIGVKFGKF